MECIDWSDYDTPYEIKLIRHTINKPRIQNIWNLFGLGYFYSAKEDI